MKLQKFENVPTFVASKANKALRIDGERRFAVGVLRKRATAFVCVAAPPQVGQKFPKYIRGRVRCSYELD
jgi:hypothetical protein